MHRTNAVFLVSLIAMMVSAVAGCSLPGLEDERAVADETPAETIEQASCPVCNGCNGKDPSYNSCISSATRAFRTSYPIKHGANTWGTVELRYSTSCGTNWSRVHSNQAGQYQMEAWVEQGTTKYEDIVYTGSSLDAWSTMHYGCNIQTRACGCITRVEVATECNCTPFG